MINQASVGGRCGTRASSRPAARERSRGVRRPCAGAGRGRACATPRRPRPFLLGVVAEPGAHRDERLVQPLVGVVGVEADQEGVTEAGLVRGVRGPQSRVRGERARAARPPGADRWRCPARDSASSASVRSCGRHVVARLVRGRQQGVQVGVGAAGRDAHRPAAAAAAVQQQARGVHGGRGVEAGEGHEKGTRQRSPGLRGAASPACPERRPPGCGSASGAAFHRWAGLAAAWAPRGVGRTAGGTDPGQPADTMADRFVTRARLGSRCAIGTQR